MSKAKYKRVLLKLSGEALCERGQYGIHSGILDRVAEEIAQAASLGVQMGIVVGGGNIFRGVQGAAQGLDRVSADQMGMLATLINSMALQGALTNRKVPTRVLSALAVPEVAETYVVERARHHLEKGRTLIFAAGTGNPFFTTDTAACLRAVEIAAQIVCKATRVDGVYDQDPLTCPQAKKFDSLTYLEFLRKELKVMDLTAISFAMAQELPIMVFNMTQKGNIHRAILGESMGTIIQGNSHA